MSIVNVEELLPGDVFDAAPFVEEEIARATAAGDIPHEGWADSFRAIAETAYFEVVEPIEVEDDPCGWVIVYAEQGNIMIRRGSAIMLENR